MESYNFRLSLVKVIYGLQKVIAPQECQQLSAGLVVVCLVCIVGVRMSLLQPQCLFL